MHPSGAGGIQHHRFDHRQCNHYERINPDACQHVHAVVQHGGKNLSGAAGGPEAGGRGCFSWSYLPLFFISSSIASPMAWPMRVYQMALPR